MKKRCHTARVHVQWNRTLPEERLYDLSVLTVIDLRNSIGELAQVVERSLSM